EPRAVGRKGQVGKLLADRDLRRDPTRSGVHDRDAAATLICDKQPPPLVSERQGHGAPQRRTGGHFWKIDRACPFEEQIAQAQGRQENDGERQAHGYAFPHQFLPADGCFPETSASFKAPRNTERAQLSCGSSGGRSSIPGGSSGRSLSESHFCTADRCSLVSSTVRSAVTGQPRALAGR